MPVRIQFVCDGRLTAEVIIDGWREADRASAAYMRLKYRRGKPMGAATISRADLPRYWNVPVGSAIS